MRDEETAYNVVLDKLDLMMAAAEECHISLEVARTIVGALPEGYQKQLGAEFDALAAAVTQYDVAVAEAAQNR